MLSYQEFFVQFTCYQCLYQLYIQYSPIKMDYFHTISALHHKLLDYFTNVIGIISY